VFQLIASLNILCQHCGSPLFLFSFVLFCAVDRCTLCIKVKEEERTEEKGGIIFLGFYLPNVPAPYLCIYEAACWKDGSTSPSHAETNAIDFTMGISASEQKWRMSSGSLTPV